MRRSFIVLLSIALLMSACSRVTIKLKTEPIQHDDKHIGMGLGLYSDNAISPKLITFNLSHNYFEPSITVVNVYPDIHKYRTLYFLDYKQTSVIVNGQTKNEIDTNINPWSKGVFKINVPSIDEGMHDFLILSLKDPDQHLDQQRQIISNRIYVSKRAVLIQSNSKLQKIANYHYVEPINIDNKKYANIFLTKGNTKDASKEINLITKNDLKNIYINLYLNKNVNTLAILTLLNSKEQQVQFIKKKTNESEGIVSIPLEINEDQLQHKNELTLIGIENPYTENDNGDGKLGWNVFFSNKVTIKN